MITSTKERRAFQRMVINAPSPCSSISRLEGSAGISAPTAWIAGGEQARVRSGPAIRVSLATSSNLLPPFEARLASCGCWRKKTVSAGAGFLSLTPETRAPVLLEMAISPCFTTCLAISSCTGCTLNWPLSTQRLAGGRELAHGRWAGPVGSIREVGLPARLRWPPRFWLAGPPQQGRVPARTPWPAEIGIPLDPAGRPSGSAGPIPRFLQHLASGLRNPLPRAARLAVEQLMVGWPMKSSMWARATVFGAPRSRWPPSCLSCSIENGPVRPGSPGRCT